MTTADMTVKLEEIDCLLCASSDKIFCFSSPNPRENGPREFSVVRCAGCALTFINPRPAWEDLSKLHPIDISSEVVPEHDLDRTNKRLMRLNRPAARAVLVRCKGYPSRRSMNPLQWAIAPFIKPWIGKEVPDYRGSGKALDIGCSNGLFLYLLKGLGWSVRGVEINPALCKAARSIDIPVFCGPFEEASLNDGEFDLIRLCHVLEHIHNPVEVLKKIKRLLSKEGRVLIEVPNVKSMSFRMFGPIWYGVPGHLYGFNPNTLSMIAKHVGLRRISIRYKASKGAFTACLREWAKTGTSFKHKIAGRLACASWFRPVAGLLCSIFVLFRVGDIQQACFEHDNNTSIV